MELKSLHSKKRIIKYKLNSTMNKKQEFGKISFYYSIGEIPFLKSDEIKLLINEGHKVKSQADRTLKMAWKAAKDSKKQKVFHNALSKVKKHYENHGVKVNHIIGNKSVNKKELEKRKKEEKKQHDYQKKEKERSRKSYLKKLEQGFIMKTNLKSRKTYRKKLTNENRQNIQKRLNEL